MNQRIDQLTSKDGNLLRKGTYTHYDGTTHHVVLSWAFPEGAWRVDDAASRFNHQWVEIGGHWQL